jgi:hypothetical protein
MKGSNPWVGNKIFYTILVMHNEEDEVEDEAS